MRKSAGLALLPLLAVLAGDLGALPKRTLTVCDDVQDPPTLDPQKQFSEKNHTLCQQIFDGLVRFDPEGRIEPALAVSWKRLDPLRMRFDLREGVTFHNGEPFDAESVRFSFERYLDPATGSPARPFLDAIARVDVVDGKTVDVVTNYPDGLLLNRLAGFVLVVPVRYMGEVGEAGFAARPVGTGAFKFARWEKGREIVLDKNEDYWMDGYPKVEELRFRFIPLESQLDEFVRGGVDILTELPGTYTTDVMAMGAQVIKKESFYTLASNFNVNEGPLKDRRVRQALNYAIDRGELIRYDLMGNGRPLATLSMSGEEGFNPDLKPYPYDPEKAKRLLVEAGYAGGLRLKAFIKNTGKRAAGIIQTQWRKIGVELDYEVKTEDEFFNEVKKAKLDLTFGGCPDPMAHVFFIQSISFFSRSPFSIAANPEYDRRLLEVISALDTDERVRLARSLDGYIHAEALGIFTYQRIKTCGVRKGVRFQPYITGMPYLFAAEAPSAR